MTQQQQQQQQQQQYTFGGKTSAEWEAQAQEARQRSYDSFERSDTDGFLSQWAADQMAIRYERLAKLAETGGRLPSTAFVDIETGEVIKGRWEQAQYGSAWAPFDRSRRWIFPSNAEDPDTKARNNEAKGIRQVLALVPMVIVPGSHNVTADPDREWTVVVTD